MLNIRAIDLNRCKDLEKKRKFRSLQILKEQEKKLRKRKSIKSYDDWLIDAHNCWKVNTRNDFDKNNCNSIESLAVKKNINVKVTSKFINGKMLRFSKISLGNFIYDVTNVMAFSGNNTQDIFLNLDIIKHYP